MTHPATPPRQCAVCVLPERAPYITLNADGLCPLCAAHQSQARSAAPQPLETDLVGLIRKQQRKRKGPYDCLVMVSGGKDSTAALYYMVTRYKLNPLAFTFDHGFENEEALANIHRAVGILDIDFLYHRSAFMKPMFRRLLESRTGAVICHVCSMWYMGLTYDTAERYGIPLIVAGWTRGQMARTGSGRYEESQIEFAEMARETEAFLSRELDDLPQYRKFPRKMSDAVKPSRMRKTPMISPHWFLPQDAREYTRVIREELGWAPPGQSYPSGSTNCLLNFLSVHRCLERYGYTHYHVEASKMIRLGRLTREEALQELAINYDKDLLNRVAATLGYRIE